jgi:hypothetical protein
MQCWRWWGWQIRNDVVPLGRHLVFGQGVFVGANFVADLGHDAPL